MADFAAGDTSQAKDARRKKADEKSKQVKTKAMALRTGKSDTSKRVAKRQAKEEAERVQNVSIVHNFATIVLSELEKNAAAYAAKADKLTPATTNAAMPAKMAKAENGKEG